MGCAKNVVDSEKLIAQLRLNSIEVVAAVEDADIANGCMWFQPGSHLRGQLDFVARLGRGKMSLEKGSRVVLNKMVLRPEISLQLKPSRAIQIKVDSDPTPTNDFFKIGFVFEHYISPSKTVCNWFLNWLSILCIVTRRVASLTSKICAICWYEKFSKNRSVTMVWCCGFSLRIAA